MNSSNPPASGDITVIAPDKAANDEAVDTSTEPKRDDDSGDKINNSPSVVKFRINDKRGTKR